MTNFSAPLLVVLALIGVASAFHSGLRPAFGKLTRLRCTGDDFDTSGMSSMSSSEIVAKRELEQLEQKQKAEEAAEAAKKAEVDARAMEAVKAAPVAVKKPVVIPGTEGVSDKEKVAAFSAGGQGFDIGLAIAFPIIIGTLALFFVFPFVGAQLAGGSGALPPELMGQ